MARLTRISSANADPATAPAPDQVTSHARNTPDREIDLPKSQIRRSSLISRRRPTMPKDRNSDPKSRRISGGNSGPKTNAPTRKMTRQKTKKNEAEMHAVRRAR